MTGVAGYTGTLSLGDLDMWSFTACTGDLISLRLNSTNFEGNLDLYGPTGALLKSAGGNATTWSITYTATNCGRFAVLVSSYYGGSSGIYGLTVNGLSDESRLCAPAISGARLTVNGIGGVPGANFILSSTTNVAKPFGLQTPVLTNQFDQYGVLTYEPVRPCAEARVFPLPRAVIPPELGTVVLCASSWQEPQWTLGFRIHFTLYRSTKPVT